MPRKLFTKGNTAGFKKGQSGNPSGQRRQVRELIEALRADHFPSVVQVLNDLRHRALTGEDWAVTEYLNRADKIMGIRAPDKIEVTRPQEMGDDELVAAAAAIVRGKHVGGEA